MANLPFPLQGQDLSELFPQLLEMFRDLYEVRIGGALIGDVFQVSGDVLQIKLKAGSGLKKTAGQLDFDMSTISAPQAAVMQSAYTAKGMIMSASAAGTIGGLSVGTDGQFLSANSTQPYGLAWTSSIVSGDVVGPSIAADSNFASFDTTTGKLIKDSGKKSTDFETSGSVSSHAALTTGIHGLIITAGQTLTVTVGGTIGSSAYTNVGDSIASSISNGDTTHSPDGNSVFDALLGKQETFEKGDEDSDSIPEFFGFTSPVGDNWKIYKTHDGLNWYYAVGDSDYTTNWTNRASLTYAAYVF
jgi:hypothetical protein